MGPSAAWFWGQFREIKTHFTAAHHGKNRWEKVTHRTATALVDYWSTKAESWKKKNGTRSSALCPSHSDGEYCIQCTETIKNRERRQKVVVLNRDERALEREQLGGRGEGSYRTSAAKEKAYRSGICLLKHEKASKKVHSKVPIAIKMHLCGFLEKDKQSRAFSRRQAGSVFNYKALY